MVTNVAFLAKSFGPFQFWTFFLSIFENPKILLEKIIIKYNKFPKQLKENYGKYGAHMIE
jgi:hypothetical protein